MICHRGLKRYKGGGRSRMSVDTSRCMPGITKRWRVEPLTDNG